MRTWFARSLLAAALVGLASVPTPGGAQGQTNAAAGDPQRGEQLFGRTGCNGCHAISGVGGQVGPDLTGVFNLDLAKDRPGQSHADARDYVRQSIEDPQAYIVPGFPQPSPMPTFELSEQDIADLMAYLQGAGAAEAN